MLLGRKQGKERKQRRCRHRNTENPKAFPMHVPLPSVWHQFHKSYRLTLFRDSRIHGTCPENLVPKALHFCVARSLRSSPPAISTSWTHIFQDNRIDWNCPEKPVPPSQPTLVRRFHRAPSSGAPPLPRRSHGALPKLFPAGLAPSQRSSPQSYFPRFPVRPPSRRFRIAPSQRSSPQAISHGSLSVHPIVASVSLLPLGALPKVFSTASFPSTLSSLPYRSFSTELSPCYFPRSPSVHPLVASIWLLPHGALPKLFPTVSSLFTPPNGALPKFFSTVSPPSTLSSLPYRALAASVTKREPKHRRCFWEKTTVALW